MVSVKRMIAKKEKAYRYNESILVLGRLGIGDLVSIALKSV
jgi:hypothetical protein